MTPIGRIRQLQSHPLLRNSAIYLAGSVGAGVFGYIFHFATGRLLGPAGYAAVASAIAALYLLTLPALVVQLVSARFTSVAAGRGHLASIRPVLVRISVATLGASIGPAVLLAIFARPVAAYLKLADVRVVYVLAGAMLLSFILTASRGALQGMRRFFDLSVNVMLDMATRVLSAAAFIRAGAGSVGALFALLIGPGLAYAHSLFLLRTLASGERRSDTPEGLGRYAILAAFAGIGINFLFSIDTVLAKHYLASESAGIYAAASILARVIYFLGLTVASVMFPEVASLNARNESHFHVVDLSLLLLLAMSAVFITAYALVPSIVLLPYGSAFNPVRPYLSTFAVALSLLALSNLLMNYFLSLNQARFVAPLLGACALETLLIFLFHSSITQIVLMVLTSLGLLSVAMLSLYGWDRLRARTAEG